MKSRLKLLPGIALLLSACSLFPARPPQPALHDFGPIPAISTTINTGMDCNACPPSRGNAADLSGAEPSPSGRGQGEGLLKNAIVMDAPAWLRDERIRYRMRHNDPTQVRFYALDAWLAPPPALLAQHLGATTINSAKYRLLLTLAEFEQVFDNPDNAHVTLSFRAQIESLEGKPATERLFQYTRPCPSPDAKGAVNAYALAVAEAVSDLRQWLTAF